MFLENKQLVSRFSATIGLQRIELKSATLRDSLGMCDTRCRSAAFYGVLCLEVDLRGARVNNMKSADECR